MRIALCNGANQMEISHLSDDTRVGNIFSIYKRSMFLTLNMVKFVNGKEVANAYVLKDGDRLEYFKKNGNLLKERQ